MKKIPSLFKRNFDNNPRLVTNEYSEGVEWVINGEGIPFRKWDGTACLIKDGKLYKRYDVKAGRSVPEFGIPCQEPDPITGHWPHWVLVDPLAPEDKWIWEAYANTLDEMPNSLFDGTYEAVGPKINGNKDRSAIHRLFRHSAVGFADVPTDFDGLSAYFENKNIEGVVWHHSSGDGRMIKIKKSDFGYKW